MLILDRLPVYVWLVTVMLIRQNSTLQTRARSFFRNDFEGLSDELPTWQEMERKGACMSMHIADWAYLNLTEVSSFRNQKQPLTVIMETMSLLRSPADCCLQELQFPAHLPKCIKVVGLSNGSSILRRNLGQRSPRAEDETSQGHKSRGKQCIYTLEISVGQALKVSPTEPWEDELKNSWSATKSQYYRFVRACAAVWLAWATHKLTVDLIAASRLQAIPARGSQTKHNIETGIATIWSILNSVPYFHSGRSPLMLPQPWFDCRSVAPTFFCFWSVPLKWRILKCTIATAGCS